MRARQDFVLHVDKKGTPVQYKYGDPLDGIKEIKVKKGDEVPKFILQHIWLFNKDFLELQYKDGVPVPPKGVGATPPPIVAKRKYSEESLNTVYEEEGMAGLKKIGAKFNPPVTDRSKNKLINEILAAQERIRRTGR